MKGRRPDWFLLNWNWKCLCIDDIPTSASNTVITSVGINPFPTWSVHLYFKCPTAQPTGTDNSFESSHTPYMSATFRLTVEVKIQSMVLWLPTVNSGVFSPEHWLTGRRRHDFFVYAWWYLEDKLSAFSFKNDDSRLVFKTRFCFCWRQHQVKGNVQTDLSVQMWLQDHVEKTHSKTGWTTPLLDKLRETEATSQQYSSNSSL